MASNIFQDPMKASQDAIAEREAEIGANPQQSQPSAGLMMASSEQQSDANALLDTAFQSMQPQNVKKHNDRS